LNNFNRSGESNLRKDFSREYLIDNNDVPRLIGKAGGTIKQIQRDNDVYLKIANDRNSQWVDLLISGSNNQVINNAVNQIENIIGPIKEKNGLDQSNTDNQSNSFFKTGILIYLFFLSFDYFYRFT
jgi:hypothetical protein